METNQDAFTQDSLQAYPEIIQKNDETWMLQALRQAERALDDDEVPIGAIIIKDEQIIGKGWNQVETLKDGTAHAEIIALSAAQSHLGDWRLNECTLYVTKEPCPMCAGALMNCRIGRVVFGARDPKAGCCGGWQNLLDSNPPLNHQAPTVGGILEEDCVTLLKHFFQEARRKKKEG